MKIEVLGTERRRRWSLQDKLQIVEETMQLGVKVSEVARRHGLAPSVVFTWRRLAREGRLGNARPAFMPVEITPVPVQTTPAVSPPRPVARDLPQRRPQRGVVAGDPRRVTLRRAMLPGVSARPPLGDAKAVLQHPDRLAPARRAHQFPLEISFSAATSST